jgi:IclR family acetate operon transcriptional repressor
MSVPSISRLLDLIEAFSESRRPMTISALAKVLQVPMSSCHAITKTLEDRGYLVELKQQGGYYFTGRLKAHVDRIALFDPLPQYLRPELARLRDTARETVLLAKLSGNRSVYLEVLESDSSIRYIAQVGDTRPLHASAAGKALLGGLQADQRTKLIHSMDLARFNASTLGTPEELAQDIEASIRRGWFMTRGEYFTGVTALAIPLSSNAELYAVVIAGPATRMEQRTAEMVGLLQDFKNQTMGMMA